jgi:lysylphosphatidylglycerol synthetase-like protein (DUF2156 family)
MNCVSVAPYHKFTVGPTRVADRARCTTKAGGACSMPPCNTLYVSCFLLCGIFVLVLCQLCEYEDHETCTEVLYTVKGHVRVYRTKVGVVALTLVGNCIVGMQLWSLRVREQQHPHYTTWTYIMVLSAISLDYLSIAYTQTLATDETEWLQVCTRALQIVPGFERMATVVLVTLACIIGVTCSVCIRALCTEDTCKDNYAAKTHPLVSV